MNDYNMAAEKNDTRNPLEKSAYSGFIKKNATNNASYDRTKTGKNPERVLLFRPL